MVRALFITLLLSSCLLSDCLDEKIRSFLTPKQYGINSKLISKIFSNRSQFYSGREIDSLKVLKKLKQEGLLELKMESYSEIRIGFRLDLSSFFALKAISDSLSAMGYNYFTIATARSGEDDFYLELSIDTLYNPDPILLSKEFEKRGIKIEDISKGENLWYYVLSTINPILPEAEQVEVGDKRSVSKLFGNYWFDIGANASSLSLNSQAGNNWYPYVVFYDKYLNILSIYERDKKSRSEILKIPEGTRFIKVGDMYGSYNIKNGFTIGLN